MQIQAWRGRGRRKGKQERPQLRWKTPIPPINMSASAESTFLPVHLKSSPAGSGDGRPAARLVVTAAPGSPQSLPGQPAQPAHSAGSWGQGSHGLSHCGPSLSCDGSISFHTTVSVSPVVLDVPTVKISRLFQATFSSSRTCPRRRRKKRKRK